MILIKTVLFSILVPGTVVGLVPYLLQTRYPVLPIDLGPIKFAGVIPVIAGILLYISSAGDFVKKGKGTPAPIDPPRMLVTSGPYRFIRNPMYTAGLLVLFGEALLYESGLVLIYLLFIWLAFHLFVLLYEEPHLKKTFGNTYVEYCRKVPRYIPRITKRDNSHN